MHRERDIDQDGGPTRHAVRQKPPLADRAAALFRIRDPNRASPQAPLPLTESERQHYSAEDFVYDAAGAECFRGLSRLESVDYIDLQRAGLDNNDAAFLRLIHLGDRHAAAMRLAQTR